MPSALPGNFASDNVNGLRDQTHNQNKRSAEKGRIVEKPVIAVNASLQISLNSQII